MEKLNAVQQNQFTKIYHRILKKKGLESIQVARRGGVRPQYLYHLLSKKSKFNVSVRKINAVCKGLGLTASQTKSLVSDILNSGPTNKTVNMKLNIPQRQRFARIYHILIKQLSLKTAQVAKRTKIKKAYLYNIISVKNKQKLPVKKARTILKGMGLTKKQTSALISALLNNQSINLKAYSKPKDDFHNRIKKAVEARQSDLTNAQIARKYHVGVATIYNYARKIKQNTRKPKQITKPIKKVKAKLNPRLKHASVMKEPSKSVGQRTAELRPKAEQVGGLTLFKPEHPHDLSPLAQNVKDRMANEQMNVRSLVYRTGLNRKRLHEFFKGDIQTLPRLTVFRLALGLKMNPDKMIVLNRPKIIVKAIPLNNSLQPRDVRTKPKSANNQTSLKELMSVAKGLNNTDLHILKAMANRMQIAEKNAN